MIFAAGLGTRMGSLTKSTPKPMLPFRGKPMIDHAITLAKAAGLSPIVANTHYLPSDLTKHLQDAGVTTLHEPKLLDTGGGLKAALPVLGASTVVTLNSDAIFAGPNPIEALLSAWRPNMRALLLLTPKSRSVTQRDTGDFSLEHGQIHRKGDYFYTGVQIINTSRLGEIDERKFSLNRYWDLLAETAPINGISYSRQWCDVGDPPGLKLAQQMTDV